MAFVHEWKSVAENPVKSLGSEAVLGTTVETVLAAGEQNPSILRTGVTNVVSVDTMPMTAAVAMVAVLDSAGRGQEEEDRGNLTPPVDDYRMSD